MRWYPEKSENGECGIWMNLELRTISLKSLESWKTGVCWMFRVQNYGICVNLAHLANFLPNSSCCYIIAIIGVSEFHFQYTSWSSEWFDCRSSHVNLDIWFSCSACHCTAGSGLRRRQAQLDPQFSSGHARWARSLWCSRKRSPKSQ